VSCEGGAGQVWQLFDVGERERPKQPEWCCTVLLVREGLMHGRLPAWLGYTLDDRDGLVPQGEETLGLLEEFDPSLERLHDDSCFRWRRVL